jgi:phosphoglycerate dehydrogenase-like enzyme
MKQQNIHEVRRKTLGLVGMGEIGCEIARRAKALEMNVLYFKRNRLRPELEQRYGVLYSDLHPMLEESDYVCLAVPHTPSTEHLIGEKELLLIGQRGFLVNISRGAVVDEEALVEALQKGTIAGAGLDVFTYEPLPADSPLCQLDNVILTPHIGGGTGSNPTLELGEALAEVESILAGNPAQVPL